MKVKDVIEMLSKYDNQEQEIMISWNTQEHMESNYDTKLTEEQWENAVLYFEKYTGESFHYDCCSSVDRVIEEEE